MKDEDAAIIHKRDADGEFTIATAVAAMHGAEVTMRPPELMEGDVLEGKDGKKLVAVRGETLLPMLGLLKKFFTCVGQVSRPQGPSRFVDPDQVILGLTLQGFTPEDFNMLQSLNQSVGAALAEEMAKRPKEEALPMSRQGFRRLGRGR